MCSSDLRWVLSGDIDISQILSADEEVLLEKFILKYGHDNYAAFKTELAHQFDYNDLRMVANHMARKKDFEKKPAI